MKSMRILALDIGSGTEDILLYDDSKTIENCVKMVLPSPSLVYSRKVGCSTKLHMDLFIKGDTIGGGEFAKALKRHLERGFRVFMTEAAAYSIRNRLDEVRNMGFQVVPDDPPPNFKGETFTIQEVNISRLQTFLEEFEEDLSDLTAVAVAVQDHGIPEGEFSNRRFRMNTMMKRLMDSSRLENLLYIDHEIPERFVRMRSAAEAARSQLPGTSVFVMDTSAAAILGCLEDPKVKGARTALLVNVGNEHVTAAITSRRKVLAVLEHHTSILKAARLESLLQAFMKGMVDGEAVFEDGGHGAFYMHGGRDIPKIDVVAVTGPYRAKLKGRIDAYFAAPGGDMMMTGPIGLVRAAKAARRNPSGGA
ncbi:pyruvate formate lyase-activating protein [Candidatus Bathyarchaeota archaeon]|nr:pyruvate formate lyase-activating protein [Candidatus Bathyarchaeota archaeon]